MTTSVRKLGPDDVSLAGQMLAMFREAFDQGAESTVPSHKYLQSLLSRPDFHALVAVREGTVIGGLTAYELEMLKEDARELFIYDVAVAHAYRRQGVGRALIESARELCVSRGLSALYLAASADDDEAVRFYEATNLKREDVAWFTQEFEPSP